MYYLAIFLSSLIVSTGFFALGKPFFHFCVTAVSQLNILIGRPGTVEDKSAALLKNLKKLLTSSGIFFGSILLILTASLLPLLFYLEFEVSRTSEINTTSPYFFLSLFSGMLIFLVLPSRKNTNYSYWSRLLHKLILDNYNLSLFLFRLELRFFSKEGKPRTEKFVVVTGLARAGTTALTDLLHQSGTFYSLIYSNMPFLLGINIWKKIYRPRKGKAKERAHRDRLMVGYNSIEALEEHFFKAFLNDRYIGKESLTAHEIEESVYESYLDYQNLIKQQHSGAIYLAKNNNMILRYKALRQFNEEFIALVLFRDPIDHARSLFEQQENFKDLQTKDSFVLEYMDWLGHHEFGLNHKVFDFGLERSWEAYETSSLNYWLALWINYYSYILTVKVDERLLLIDYSDLICKPRNLLDAIAIEMEFELTFKHLDSYQKKETQEDIILELDSGLVKQADSIHSDLVASKLRIA